MGDLVTAALRDGLLFSSVGRERAVSRPVRMMRRGLRTGQFRLWAGKWLGSPCKR